MGFRVRVASQNTLRLPEDIKAAVARARVNHVPTPRFLEEMDEEPAPPVRKVVKKKKKVNAPTTEDPTGSAGEYDDEAPSALPATAATAASGARPSTRPYSAADAAAIYGHAHAAATAALPSAGRSRPRQAPPSAGAAMRQSAPAPLQPGPATYDPDVAASSSASTNVGPAPRTAPLKKDKLSSSTAALSAAAAAASDEAAAVAEEMGIAPPRAPSFVVREHMKQLARQKAQEEKEKEEAARVRTDAKRRRRALRAQLKKMREIKGRDTSDLDLGVCAAAGSDQSDGDAAHDSAHDSANDSANDADDGKDEITVPAKIRRAKSDTAATASSGPIGRVNSVMGHVTLSASVASAGAAVAAAGAANKTRQPRRTAALGGGMGAMAGGEEPEANRELSDMAVAVLQEEGQELGAVEDMALAQERVRAQQQLRKRAQDYVQSLAQKKAEEQAEQLKKERRKEEARVKAREEARRRAELAVAEAERVADEKYKKPMGAEDMVASDAMTTQMEFGNTEPDVEVKASRKSRTVQQLEQVATTYLAAVDSNKYGNSALQPNAPLTRPPPPPSAGTNSRSSKSGGRRGETVSQSATFAAHNQTAGAAAGQQRLRTLSAGAAAMAGPSRDPRRRTAYDPTVYAAAAALPDAVATAALYATEAFVDIGALAPTSSLAMESSGRPVPKGGKDKARAMVASPSANITAVAAALASASEGAATLSAAALATEYLKKLDPVAAVGGTDLNRAVPARRRTAGGSAATTQVSARVPAHLLLPEGEGDQRCVWHVSCTTDLCPV